QSGFLLVLAEFLGYAVLFFALKLLFLRHDKPLLASLGWIRQPSFRPLHLVITGFLLAVAMVLLGWILQTPDIQTPFEKLLNDRLSRIVIALFGITLGPVVEELLFRGFLQPVLVDHFGALPGILATSILFGGMHLIQNANIWQSGVVIAIVGFVLGVIRHISGSTRASALTHIAYNSLPFLALLADTGKHT
ncbi:MAG TPA: CPBP family intramembrane glutamic endopeptidase, partial [Bryobacteraceae bacterium]|nr:CPBP family intramembrane glutamic endopeptidase [Bryobacteraceae bacterium]